MYTHGPNATGKLQLPPTSQRAVPMDAPIIPLSLPQQTNLPPTEPNEQHCIDEPNSEHALLSIPNGISF